MGIKDINGLKIKGGMFAKETSLEFGLHSNEPNKEGKDIEHKRNLCLIYGRNGSGKSTISRAIAKIAGKEKYNIDSIESAIFFDIQGNDIDFDAFSDIEKDSFHIFNEDFARANVGIKEDTDNSGLAPIVTIGEQKEIQEKIDELKTQLKELLPEFEEAQEDFYAAGDPGNEACPEFYTHRMLDQLRGQGHWGGRDAVISRGEGRNATPATESVIETISEHDTDKSRDELFVEFNKKLSSLNEIRKNNSKIETPVPVYEFEGNNYIRLLSEVVLKSSLSDRESRLLQFSLGQNQLIQKIKDEFSNASVDFCPFCQRSFASGEKEQAIKNLEKILENRQSKFKDELRNAKIYFYKNCDLRDFQTLGAAYIDCKNALEKAISAADRINGLLDRKIEDTETVIKLSDDFCRIFDIFADYNSKAKLLEQDRLLHNEACQDLTPLQDELRKLNYQLAYKEIEDDYNLWKEKENEQFDIHSNYRSLSKSKNEKTAQISELEASLKGELRAVQEINEYLSLIFYSTDALRLVHSPDGYYRLTNASGNLTIKDISTGERNVLALCYFFASMLNGQKETEFNKHTQFIVIDDPISSFDADKLIGVLSLLHSKILELHEKNSGTKFVLLTHDLYTFTEMFNALKDSTLAGSMICTKELKNTTLGKCKSDFSEYSKMLGIVFDYAYSAKSDLDLFIGNTIRRAAEAYGTFVYKKGLWCLKHDHPLWEKISSHQLSSKNIVNHLRAFLSRCVLNEGSHTGDRLNQLRDTYLHTMLSSREKQRTAQLLLCMLYLLDGMHLCAHLEEHLREANYVSCNFDNFLENQIKQWLENIENFPEQNSQK